MLRLYLLGVVFLYTSIFSREIKTIGRMFDILICDLTVIFLYQRQIIKPVHLIQVEQTKSSMIKV